MVHEGHNTPVTTGLGSSPLHRFSVGFAPNELEVLDIKAAFQGFLLAEIILFKNQHCL